MQLYYPVPPVPAKPTKRMPASQRQCLIGRNRKARKVFCMLAFKQGLAVTMRPPKDPIYYKRLRREARHMENSWSMYK